MEPMTLSSDVLEEVFGPTHIVVLHEDDYTRAIATVDTRQAILELSMVWFLEGGVREYKAAHKRVMNHESMGKVFKSEGLAFWRHAHEVFRFTLPDNFSRLFGSSAPATIVDVTILVGPDKTPYARILETYTPVLKKWQTTSEQPDDIVRKKIEQFDAILENVT